MFAMVITSFQRIGPNSFDPSVTVDCIDHDNADNENTTQNRYDPGEDYPNDHDMAPATDKISRQSRSIEKKLV